MKRILLLTVALTLSPLTAAYAATGPTTGPRPRTIIVSGGAPNSDLHLNWMKTFQRFERTHQMIASEFTRDPALIRSAEFEAHHPEWAKFLESHPELRASIEDNPGNYVVVPPEFMAAAGYHEYSEASNWSGTGTWTRTASR